jgi:DNA-binding GntR family transcriptional regulator
MRSKLFSGELEGDAQLTEAEVATLYGVARPTAKASIEKLVAEGLLIRGTHRTARVPSLGEEDVHDLFFARKVIESEAVRQLAQRRLLPPNAPRANADARAVAAASDINLIEPVMRFHVSLVNAVGSPRLSRLFSTLMGEMQLCMVQMHSESTLKGSAIVHEHEVLTRLIEAGDADGAVDALVDHLDRGEARLLGRQGEHSAARRSRGAKGTRRPVTAV